MFKTGKININTFIDSINTFKTIFKKNTLKDINEIKIENSNS